MKREEKQQTTKDRITSVTNKYLATADQWTTAQIIQQHTEQVIDQLIDLANLKKRYAVREPQSEQEEVKETKLEKEVAKEIRKFIEALQNMKIVQEKEIKDLQAVKVHQLSQNQIPERLKDKITGVQQTISQCDKEIAALQKQVADNHKLADLVLIEIKAVFIKAIAQIQISQTAVQIQLPILRTKTREILAKTDFTGSGDDYLLPAQIDFNNPITAIIEKISLNPHFSFVTKDGTVAAHPWKKRQFTRHEIKWAEVAKIQVYYGYCIWGFQFIDKQNKKVLKIGDCDPSYKVTEVVLQAGERLLQIRSKHDDNSNWKFVHCNMTLVIGRQE